MISLIAAIAVQVTPLALTVKDDDNRITTQVKVMCSDFSITELSNGQQQISCTEYIEPPAPEPFCPQADDAFEGVDYLTATTLYERPYLELEVGNAVSDLAAYHFAWDKSIQNKYERMATLYRWVLDCKGSNWDSYWTLQRQNDGGGS